MDTHGVEVNHEIITFSFEDLRRQIMRAPEHGKGPQNHPVMLLQQLSGPHIQQLQIAVFLDIEILGFQIAINNAFVV